MRASAEFFGVALPPARLIRRRNLARVARRRRGEPKILDSQSSRSPKLPVKIRISNGDASISAEEFSVGRRGGYDAAVLGLGNIGRRLFESVVGLFAILGFVYVPLGRHTGFEHARAVLSTPAASAAIDDLSRTALGLRQRAVDFVTHRAVAEAVPTAPESPSQPAKAHAGPRPLPPKLK